MIVETVFLSELEVGETFDKLDGAKCIRLANSNVSLNGDLLLYADLVTGVPSWLAGDTEVIPVQYKAVVA